MLDNILEQSIYQINHQNFEDSDRNKVISSLIENLSSVDFSDINNRRFANNFISEILSEKIGQRDEPITEYQALAVHYIITKCSLLDQNINVSKINYTTKSGNSNAGAFYDNANGSVNFFIENVCDKYNFLDKYNVNNPERGGASRLDRFLREIFVINHELQHVKQFTDMNKVDKVEDFTPELYLMEKQHSARILSLAEGSKYQSKSKNSDRLYQDNHDQFLFEIDADRNGYEQSLNILQKICPKAYQIAVGPNNRYQQKLADINQKIENNEQVTWEHDTNPNNSGVRADYKASLIVDTIVSMMNKADKNAFLKEYPSILLTHNSDGKKKTLEEVEKECQSKLSYILDNDKSDNRSIKMATISKLYETVIESDPVLSLEKTLKHVSDLNYESDRFFTDSGKEVKYSDRNISQEIKTSLQKANTLISYIEEVDRKQVDTIIKNFENEIFSAPKNNPVQIRLYEAKKNALFSLNYTSKTNIALETDRKEELSRNKNKNTEREKAKNILTSVFPNLKPIAYAGTINNSGEVELHANQKEKFILLQNYHQLMMQSTSYKGRTQSHTLNELGVTSLTDVRKAIETLYPFEITPEKNFELCQQKQSGKLELQPDIFGNNKQEIKETQDIIEKQQHDTYNKKNNDNEIIVK